MILESIESKDKFAALLAAARVAALAAFTDILAKSDDPVERRYVASAILRIPDPDAPPAPARSRTTARHSFDPPTPRNNAPSMCRLPPFRAPRELSASRPRPPQYPPTAIAEAMQQRYIGPLSSPPASPAAGLLAAAGAIPPSGPASADRALALGQPPGKPSPGLR